MRIWVDLANSPQVLFFDPLIKQMEQNQHTVLITSRHFAQTVPLADQFGLQHTPIGSHGGKRKVNLVWNNLNRARLLAQWAKENKVELAVSHNSYGQAVAAKLAGIPFVTLMDYEHQPGNHICFRLARRVIVPEPFPDEFCQKYGANGKSVHYSGIKEQVYLTQFQPIPDWLQQHHLPQDKILVAVRPPGTWGFYSKKSNPLFGKVLSHIVSHKEVFVVFLPRIEEQKTFIKDQGWSNVYIPDQVLDGANLQYVSDMVISGGGTMNREAAVMGTPAYSIFNGQVPAVDNYLEQLGRLKHISDETQISQIKIERKSESLGFMKQPELIKEIVNLIETSV